MGFAAPAPNPMPRATDDARAGGTEENNTDTDAFDPNAFFANDETGSPGRGDDTEGLDEESPPRTAQQPGTETGTARAASPAADNTPDTADAAADQVRSPPRTRP